jgi:hypothetical protein
MHSRLIWTGARFYSSGNIENEEEDGINFGSKTEREVRALSHKNPSPLISSAERRGKKQTNKKLHFP